VSVAPRSLFPLIAVAAILGAVAWALQGAQLPPADFTFCNGTEVKSLDPSIVTGQPENNMVNALFEGLVRWNPKTLDPLPGVAERWDISEDKLTYTFHLRDEAAWSDGSQMTADDFAYSLRRLLDPRTAAQYSYQSWYVKNARRYNGGVRAVQLGDAVEVELNLPPDAINTLRGRVLRGKLVSIADDDGAELDDDAWTKAAGNESVSIESWTFVVEIDGKQRRFRYADDAQAARESPPARTDWCRQVLLDFREVGIEVVDHRTVRYTLDHPTPYFLNLVGFYPLFPVNGRCVERFGSPQWTYPENIVCNGAFIPKFRRIRDRTRLAKNEQYWNRDEIKLNTIDVLAVESVNTALNLFLTGKADWIYDLPSPALRQMLKADPPRDDLNPQPVLYTYFYLINTTKKPLDDVRVRKSLALAVDRREITERLLGGGERVARSLVPPLFPGYTPQECPEENVAEARRLLAEAGYPDGRGFPTFTILYNTHETHQSVAQLVRKQWQRNLGIKIRGRNEEFATYLNSQRQLTYDISRRGWSADYLDPNTFLDMYVSGNDHNNTGWTSPEFDRLMHASAEEVDPQKRLGMLADAERILMDNQPIIPLYFYVSKNLVKPYVRGFYNNAIDNHHVWAMWLDREQTTPNGFLEGRR
jgi:oligopeptide transport system substrate-binding protein